MRTTAGDSTTATCPYTLYNAIRCMLHNCILRTNITQALLSDSTDNTHIDISPMYSIMTI